MISAANFDTPVGRLGVLAEGTTVVAAGFVDRETLRARLPRRLRAEPVADGIAEELRTAIAAYFDGDVGALDAVAVSQEGGPFQRAAWDALRTVPPGTTVSYTELAARAGNPRAVRAAGTACGANLVAPFVPCHRIVRSDGHLGGYGYGLAVKRWLLDHERRHADLGSAVGAR